VNFPTATPMPMAQESERTALNIRGLMQETRVFSIWKNLQLIQFMHSNVYIFSGILSHQSSVLFLKKDYHIAPCTLT
jgi:hypothetical protein